MAMLVQSRLEELGESFAHANIRALLLHRPSLERLEAAHSHFQLDLAVRRRQASSARKALRANRWELLWFSPGAARFERDRVGLNLIWRLGFPWTPRPLKRALWRDARPGEAGLAEPRCEPLVVLAAWGSSRLTSPRGQVILGCAPRIRDWEEVWKLAVAAGARDTLQAALEGQPLDPLTPSPHGWLWRAANLVSRARLRLHEGPLHPFSCNFAGLPLRLGWGVFHPQPTAERMVESALRLLDEVERPTVVDAGTGCGAVALAVAAGRPEAEVHGTELSRAALRNARHNGRRLRLPNVRFHLGSLLDPVERLKGSVDLLTAILPYLPSGVAAGSIHVAPRLALDGGADDGLGLLRELALQAQEFLTPGGWWLFQLPEAHWEGFSAELSRLGYRTRLLVRWPGRVVLAGATSEGPGN